MAALRDLHGEAVGARVNCWGGTRVAPWGLSRGKCVHRCEPAREGVGGREAGEGSSIPEADGRHCPWAGRSRGPTRR